MPIYFDHEKLDVYRVALQFTTWVYRLYSEFANLGYHLKDQLSRASTSIILNIAEGNGKRSPLDRNRFFQIARGSSMECAACLDVLVASGICSEERIIEGKNLLFRVVSMLSKMTAPEDSLPRVRTNNKAAITCLTIEEEKNR